MTKTKKNLFYGAATALITPFCNGEIDYDSFGRLIERQIDRGIDALVICGTTGENATLSDSEHRAVLEFSLEKSGGRVPMIAGTGSNDTTHAIETSRYAASIGYDGLLVVTPYYNKATDSGLIAHFEKIADCNNELAGSFEKAAAVASSLEMLFDNLPTKRYTRARLNRITAELLQ